MTAILLSSESYKEEILLWFFPPLMACSQAILWLSEALPRYLLCPRKVITPGACLCPNLPFLEGHQLTGLGPTLKTSVLLDFFNKDTILK